MKIRWALATAISVGLAVSTVELTCIASERRLVVRAHEAASIATAAPEGDLPGIIDGDPDVTRESTYTR